jgi:hypothetical protein
MTVIFLHIPKTGGTTITRMLRKEFSRQECFDHVKLKARRRRHLEQPDGVHHGIKCVLGHYRYGIHTHFDQPARYFTMLRDPVERILSMYSYKREKNHDNVTEDTTLAEFLEHHEPASNGQTHYLCDAPEVRGDPEYPDVESAKRNLMRCTAFGLTEFFDDSLRLYQAKGIPIGIKYSVRNVTGARLRRDDVSETDMNELLARNALDIELYDFARQEFERLRAGLVNT